MGDLNESLMLGVSLGFSTLAYSYESEININEFI